MTTLWIAQKMPHSNGAKEGVFHTEKEAHDWLTEEVENEPDVSEYEVQENDVVRPDYTYRITEGKGEVAGVVSGVPLRSGTPTDRLDKRHHNAPKDGNDDPEGI